MDPGGEIMELDEILEKLTPTEQAYINGLIDKDPLTGVYNRRKFDRDIELVVAMAERDKKGSGLIIIDIDHFKKYNDKHGHQRGDQALKEVTQCIENGLREYDKIHIYRYGGEEFVVIIPNITIKDAFNIGDRLRKNVKRDCGITISVGVSHYKEISDDIQSLLNHADDALYRAKRKGRDRVEVYE